MLFDDPFVQSLPEDPARAVLDVFRRFRDFNQEIEKLQGADKNNLMPNYQFEDAVFEDYLCAYSFLQSFARRHGLNVNISQAPLSPSDLMDRHSFVDRVRDGYSSLESIYYESVAAVARDTFDDTFGLKPEDEPSS